MLQRATNNAYSWWWASHIRTKQSKWLEQSLQDMEDKVQGMLKLIEEDGDSFAKRAEMYYKRRPELINSVEESYKAFRALADRFDLLSKELQNANHTIATVFPEQVQFMVDDEESPPTKFPKNPQKIPNMTNIPQVLKAPKKELKRILTTASQQLKDNKSKEKVQNKEVVKSGLTKDEAFQEIGKIQKEILELQTNKEFVKSLYESGLAKYWGIENQIMEMQQKVSRLQDEFNVENIMEDDEARKLMAEAALKSCQETLSRLLEKHDKSTKEAKEEYEKIESVCHLLKSLKQKFYQEDDEAEEKNDVIILIPEETKTEPLMEKPKENLDLSSMGFLTVTEMAEKIDELVNKVISLETAVSSETVLINMLRIESDDLLAQIRKLENEKDSFTDGEQNLSSIVKEVEKKLTKIRVLNKNVERQNSNLEMDFAEAHSSLSNLSGKVSSVTPDDELGGTDSSNFSEARSSFDNLSDKLRSVKLDEELEGTDSSPSEEKLVEDLKIQKVLPILDDGDEISFRDLKTKENDDVKEVDMNAQVFKPCVPEQGEVEKTAEKSVVPEQEVENSVIPEQVVEKTTQKSVTVLEQKPNDEDHVDSPKDTDKIPDTAPSAEAKEEKNGDINWQQLLLCGMEDREKILLKEYTSILRNYRDVKKNLSDMEKKERDSQFDITLQMRQQMKAILKRDEVIERLRQKLNMISDSTEEEFVIKPDDLEVNEGSDVPLSEKEAEIKFIFIENTSSVSIVEEKLRTDIDTILDENLDFWLRFCTAFHEVQKFKNEVQDLQNEIVKLKEKKKQEGSTMSNIKSEVRPIYKHLREIETELTVWLEQSVSLKEELKRRFASLCKLQEEITKTLKECVQEDEIRFSSHQAAKFQGEVLNMKQENNKVGEELQAGLNHVGVLQIEIEKTLRKLNDDFGVSSDQSQWTQAVNRGKIPLRSFIFGTKSKKQKQPIFACMYPSKGYLSNNS